MKLTLPLTLTLHLLLGIFPSAICFFTVLDRRSRPIQSKGGTILCSSSTTLSMSLKPAAIPLMDSGKALARSGEFLIDLTTALDVYGGALSAAGAQIRNAGDSVAQAAASCRFKTGQEIVCDELRESATCLEGAALKLKQAVKEANIDKFDDLASRIESTVNHVDACSIALEAAGAGIMQRQPREQVGLQLTTAGQELKQLAILFSNLKPDEPKSRDSGQRMAFAAEKMEEAGKELQGIKKPKPTGKKWLKG